MKVLNLQCSQQHSFEGWFSSEDDFQSQLVRGLVECPLCGEKTIAKMPSAPRLNFGALRAAVAPTTPLDECASGNSHPGTDLVTVAQEHSQPGPTPAQQAAFLQAVRHVINTTEDVGDRFANQARAMHYGDIETRGIRGQATHREARDLIEEGIDVMALPVPAALKETLQ